MSAAIRGNHRITIYESEENVQVSYVSVQSIVSVDLCMRLVSTGFVSALHSDDQKYIPFAYDIPRYLCLYWD